MLFSFENITFAPESVAALIEKRLVGEVGASREFFNAISHCIPSQSLMFTEASLLVVTSWLLRVPSGSSTICLSGLKFLSYFKRYPGSLRKCDVAPQSICDLLMRLALSLIQKE